METGPLQSYRLEFAKRALGRREDDLRLRDQIRRREEKNEERERAQEGAQEELLDIAAMVLATEAEIADFTIKLDSYDTATIEALMENEEALGQVREKMRVMLDKAYVLPDGRKVFKTEDGTRVFDEHGEEVKDFDPKAVEDWRPKHEEFQKIFAEGEALTKERKELVEFQEKLDEARENVNADDGISKAELGELEKRLQESAPDAVKAKMAKDDPAQDAKVAAALNAEATFRPAGKLEMPAL